VFLVIFESLAPFGNTLKCFPQKVVWHIGNFNIFHVELHGVAIRNKPAEEECPHFGAVRSIDKDIGDVAEGKRCTNLLWS